MTEENVAPIRKKRGKRVQEDVLVSLTNKLQAHGISKSRLEHRINEHLNERQKIIYCTPEEGSNCFWCKYKITPDIIILGIPIWTEVTDVTKYAVEGNFCSLNCIKAYCKSNTSVRYRDSLNLLYLLWKELGWDIRNVEVAANWLTIDKFGGDISHDEFRKNFITLPQRRKTDYEKNIIYLGKIYIVQN